MKEFNSKHNTIMTCKYKLNNIPADILSLHNLISKYKSALRSFSCLYAYSLRY